MASIDKRSGKYRARYATPLAAEPHVHEEGRR